MSATTLCTHVMIMLLMAQHAFAAQPSESPPAEWRTFSGPVFQLSIPPTLTNVPGRGIDTFEARFESTNMILSVSYGVWSNGSSKGQPTNGPSVWGNNYRFAITNIGGREAELVSYEERGQYPHLRGRTNILRAQVPNVRSDSGLSSGLTVRASCRTAADCAIALKSFESVRIRSD